jgi:hypothetical protein
MRYNSSRLLYLGVDHVLYGNVPSRFLTSFMFDDDATPPPSNVYLASTFGRQSRYGTQLVQSVVAVTGRFSLSKEVAIERRAMVNWSQVLAALTRAEGCSRSKSRVLPSRF